MDTHVAPDTQFSSAFSSGQSDTAFDPSGLTLYPDALLGLIAGALGGMLAHPSEELPDLKSGDASRPPAGGGDSLEGRPAATGDAVGNIRELLV